MKTGVGWHRASAPLFFRFFVFVRFAVITAGTQNLTVCDHGPATLAPWFHMIRLETFLRDINAAQGALTLADTINNSPPIRRKDAVALLMSDPFALQCFKMRKITYMAQNEPVSIAS